LDSNRSIKVIILILFVGAMLGTLLGELLGYILPDGVVKNFFLQGVEFSLGGLFGSENDAISLDLGIIAFVLGLRIKLNFVGLFGLAASYYFLRYFR